MSKEDGTIMTAKKPPGLASFVNDNVYTKAFTPREYQVELLDLARKRDMIVCLASRAAQNFISLQLINSYACHCDKPGVCVCLMEDSQCALQLVRDVKGFTALSVQHVSELEPLAADTQVAVTSSSIILTWLEEGCLSVDGIKLLIIDQCHLTLQVDSEMAKVIDKIRASSSSPRVLGLTSSLLDGGGVSAAPSLEAQLSQLEQKLGCMAETASDVLSILRFFPRPHEILLESSSPKLDCPLTLEILHQVNDAREFLGDHRFDLADVYGDFIDEVEDISDPETLPLAILSDLQSVLTSMGAWCADRAALVLLLRVEQLKVKTKYERHYLLLCMVSSLLIKIRAICDHEFQHYEEQKRIYHFSSHKILRLLEILKEFRDSNKKKSSIDKTSVSETIVEQIEPVENGETSETSSPTSVLESNSVIISDVIKSNHEETSTNCETEKTSIIENKITSNEKTQAEPNVKPKPRFERRFRGSPRKFRRPLPQPQILPGEIEPLCGIVFVTRRFTAQVLYHLLNAARHVVPELDTISPQYTASLGEDGEVKDMEHRKQEEVLKRFRLRECNLLVCTSMLEEGVELPRCNLVIRFDPPSSFRSMVQSRGRARGNNGYYVTLVEEKDSEEYVTKWAQSLNMEKLLLSRCYNCEPSESDEKLADDLCLSVPPYCPNKNSGGSSVALCGAMTLVNRYCAKLPSDTFTRLTPIWRYEEVNGLVRCCVRLPINCPLKREIVGPATKFQVMARRLAALEMCKALFEVKELDIDLQPVGKESFLAQEQANLGYQEEEEGEEEEQLEGNFEHRPGTTKRRQYYYKKIADSLMECRPEPGQEAYLYHINLQLSCPLPEEQNTRGRKIYPPEESPRGFGILTLKPIPQICPFPIFTRSGEVCVSLELSPQRVVLSSEQSEKVVAFLNYTFSSVLRLQKHLMIFGPESAENSYYIVPVTNKPEAHVDWKFVDLIWQEKDSVPSPISEDDRKNFKFEYNKYQDAVVMPWYRNQDQPQYFYVAEICTQLSPKSEFPGGEYHTFEEYYNAKYGLKVQCPTQPLLDVDHTSARLNFLTPRYVNRKGVALPVSSEHTKRNKRENLEQKQILVAELCSLHPFPASLWRQAVCLPCILYRINGLLLADELRCKVAKDIGLGKHYLPPEFRWSPLDFGWSLAEVLQKSREAITNGAIAALPEALEPRKKCKIIELPDEDSEEVKEGKGETKSWLEIGTWSNEMASSQDDDCDSLLEEMPEDLPCNITLLTGNTLGDGPPGSDWGTGIKNNTKFRYGSPTFIPPRLVDTSDTYSSFSDDDDLSSDMSEEPEIISDSQCVHPDGLRIEFKGDHVAEAFDDQPAFVLPDDIIAEPQDAFLWDWQDLGPNWNEIKENYEKQVLAHQELIRNSDMLHKHDKVFETDRRTSDNETGIHRHLISDNQTPLTTNIIETQDENSEINVTNNTTVEEISTELVKYHNNEAFETDEGFSFDKQPQLNSHPGPSPSIILQALTMSNANDGINLERLETIGDSFLKYAITTYLYCTHENIHEGKLSHLRSKQVSNLQLYRLGRDKQLGRSMIATKFEPHDNWLPPCYFVPWKLEKALIKAGVPPGMWNRQELASLRLMDNDTIDKLVWERKNELLAVPAEAQENSEHLLPFVPYNLLTQHSIPDKSLADCVEALIGAYLIACGPRGALLFMSWLGIRVLPLAEQSSNEKYGCLAPPPSPLLRHVINPEGELERMLRGFDKFEERLKYQFRDRAYLLQAMSHASYSPNRLTDCYQRLEFLGDAVLDYLITRYLYEDVRQHSPGALTDLRSALVNNAIFAVLAVRHGFHQFFLHLSPGLSQVIQRFVRLQEANNHCLSPQYYVLGDHGDCSEAEDIEVPKALGDVFESVAGAIFLDSGMSLDAVWKTYHAMMAPELELFSAHVPKSPIRELLEREPETAKFGKPEKLADGRRVRVSVEVFGQGIFRGIGRNYRIAKSTAAKCALRHLAIRRSTHMDVHRFY